MSNERAQEIPGLVFDEERGRYFAVTHGESRFNQQYTNNAVQANKRKKRQERRTRQKEKAKSRTPELKANLSMTEHPQDPDAADLATRLGASPFSFFTLVVSKLKNAKVDRKLDYAIHPYPKGLEQPENQVIYYDPLLRDTGTALLPLGLAPLAPRGNCSYTAYTFTGMVTKDVDYIFHDSYPAPLVGVNPSRQRFDVDFETLLTMEAVDPYTTDPTDWGLMCYTVTPTQLLLITNQSVIGLLLLSFDDDQLPGTVLEFQPVFGNLQDPIADRGVISFSYLKTMCVVNSRKLLTWEVGHEIYRHFRYVLLVEGGRLFTTFVLVTPKTVEIRELLSEVQSKPNRWTGPPVSIPRQEHNNSAPIFFLHESVAVVEEDNGNFLAIDLKTKRLERFFSQAIKDIKFESWEPNVIFYEDEVYLSSEKATYVLK